MRVAIAVVLLAACSSKPDPDSVNALVDHVKNPKLRFVEREVTLAKGRDYERTLSVIVPDAWGRNAAGEEFYVDPDDREKGSISFSSSCYGVPCNVGDFKGEIEKGFAEMVKGLGARVLSNRSTSSERQFAIQDSGGKLEIERFWWSGDPPNEYFGCWMVIPADFEPSRAAFEKACDLVVVHK